MISRPLAPAPLLPGVLLVCCAPALAQDAFFLGLGPMPNVLQDGPTYGNSLSADGSTVVGYGWNTQNRERAWRWTLAQGYQDLGDLGGGSADAYDVNADGSAVVGYSYSPTNEHLGFRWTAQTGMQALPMYEAIDISGDGDFMVGLNVWRTTSGQTGNFDTSFNTLAAGVSTTGNVVVGYKYFGQFAHAFRWTLAGGLQDLGVTTGTESDAGGVSGDGSVVVGEARDNAIQQFWRAFRWTASTGMQDLGTLGGPMSNAFDASFDGSVIVGTSLVSGSSASNRAFVWTAQTGMRDLRQELLNAGVTSVQNWFLLSANGVSSDGRIICGTGIPGSLRPSQPFIAFLPLPGGGGTPCYANCDGSTGSPVLNVADFTCFLQRFAGGAIDANCDGSTVAPMLNVGDFTCFLQRFASGCP
jgi:probable HAF family extracellular repeat protein